MANIWDKDRPILARNLNSDLSYRISANSFRTCMYCDLWLNSKKNSFRGNYSRICSRLLQPTFGEHLKPHSMRGSKLCPFYSRIVPHLIWKYSSWLALPLRCQFLECRHISKVTPIDIHRCLGHWKNARKLNSMCLLEWPDFWRTILHSQQEVNFLCQKSF